ncbi:MAG TPA: CheR family methyltransferase [Magnetospirillum sp.]|nr:CheR family methyltransferase [Magnetospirillum sp.]
MMTDFSSDHLCREDFGRLAEYIQGATGIRMPPGKKTMLEGRLRRRLRDLGMGGFSDYCRFLFDENGLADEAVHLIDAVTTNKTDFFREPDHFHYLAGHALPEMTARGWGVRRPLAVWSAAASIGAEAYSLAMLLADYARVQHGFDFSILATDICTEVLETGARGIYPEAMIEPVPQDMRRRYLRRSRDRSAATVRIAPELRAQVQFARLNLIEAPYGIDDRFEVIFCRNILIYFDRPTQQKVISQLCGHLRPGGYLFIGHSETLSGMALPLRQVATTVFQHE